MSGLLGTFTNVYNFPTVFHVEPLSKTRNVNHPESWRKL